MDPQTPPTQPQPTTPPPAPAPNPVPEPVTPPVQTAAPVTPAPAPKTSGGIGPLVGIVIIIAILAIGGIYYWMTELNMQALEEEDQQTVTPGNTDTNTANTNSDDTSAIENDLQGTSVDVDGGLETNVNNEFNN
jgi:uncharacterized protein HemX